ncbi:hypothetical protein U1Q18_042507 [Sarracenia purpurea var. burkii]
MQLLMENEAAMWSSDVEQRSGAGGGVEQAERRDGSAGARRDDARRCEAARWERDGATEATRSDPRWGNSTAEDRGAAVVHSAGAAGAGDDDGSNSPGWSGGVAVGGRRAGGVGVTARGATMTRDATSVGSGR